MITRAALCVALVAALCAGIAAQYVSPVVQHRPTVVAKQIPAVTTVGNRTIFARPQTLGVAGEESAPKVRSVLHVPKRMQFGEFVWDEQNVAAGQVWVRVDLTSQVISVFRGQDEIGTAVILYGADQKATPTGQFPILAKMRTHRSSIYDAPMPFTLRLTGDGISIHGSDVRWGAATHGCIGVPVKFAEKLFDQVSTGNRVFIVGNSTA